MNLKVTIIDDSLETRKDAYDRVLLTNEAKALNNRFDIRGYISTYTEFQEAFDSPDNEIEIVDAYIVDIFLDTGDWGREGVNTEDIITKLIKIVPFRLTPVILVSQQWGDNTQRILEILKLVRRYDASLPEHIIDYIVWDDFEVKERQSALQVRLDAVISRHALPSVLPKRPDEPIRILMLSDTQFGDPNTDPMTELVATQIHTRLHRDKRLPDLILLAGDISYSGHPDEFVLAKKWLKKLMKKFFHEGLSGDRIILTPGNHDVNLRFSAANEWNYKPPKPFKKKGRWERAKKVGEGCQAYALEAFRRFAYDITGQKEWQDITCPKFWIDNRFIEIGLRFYVFNTVYKLGINYKSPAFGMASLDKTNNRYIYEKAENKGKVFNLTLSHHGEPPTVQVPAQNTEQPPENWDVFRDVALDTYNIKACIYGHYHESSISPFDNGVYKIILPTLRIKTKPPIQRGFSVLELQRKGGIVTEATVYPYLSDENQQFQLANTNQATTTVIYTKPPEENAEPKN